MIKNALRPLNPKIIRKNVHTGVTILHDSDAKLKESCDLLLHLGFKRDIDSVQDDSNSSLNIHRFHNRSLFVDLVEHKRLSMIRGLIASSKPLIKVIKIEIFQDNQITPPPSSIDIENFVSTATGIGKMDGIKLALVEPGDKDKDKDKDKDNNATNDLFLHNHVYNTPQDKAIGTNCLQELCLPYSYSSQDKDTGVTGVTGVSGSGRNNFIDIFTKTGLEMYTSQDTPLCKKHGHAHYDVYYDEKTSLKLRLFPTSFGSDSSTSGNVGPAVGVTLRVDDILHTEKYMKDNGIYFARLGNAYTSTSTSTSISEDNDVEKEKEKEKENDMELQITNMHLCNALDIRFTQSNEIKPFYREGISSVLEGTIDSIQNSRVAAGDNDDSKGLIDSRTLNGDCWSEVRGMVITKTIGEHGIMNKGSKNKNDVLGTMNTKIPANYSMGE
jgi:hypothetical protein